MNTQINRILTATGLVLFLAIVASAYIANPVSAVSETDQTKYEVNVGTFDTQAPSPVSRGTFNRVQEDRIAIKKYVRTVSRAADETDQQQVTKTKAPVHTTTSAKSKDPAYSSNDLDLLARLITAEAQAEPYEAKVAVGAVVMNRVKSGDFPNSINQVIYQNINGYDQFAPVGNGWIEKPALPDCVKAAKDALNGRDPTNGALFYYDNKTTNPWMLEKRVSTHIGNMAFAY